MKTLVIHPSDETTDFLSVIYEGTDWTIMGHNISKKLKKELIKSHDRIIMLGHGTEQGLIGYLDKAEIDSNYVYLLREKYCVCIWCNADVFFKRYDLTGFYTGVIISEVDEAFIYGIPAGLSKVEESNELFSKSIKECIDSDNMLDDMKEKYEVGDNLIIEFNHDNLYHS